LSDDDALDDLVRRAVTFPGSSIPMAGLRTALATVEAQLKHARDQITLRLCARHERAADTLHPDDRELDLYELEVTVKQIVPRVFRGGFVLTLWSTFEVVSMRMAKYAAIQKGLEIAKSQWKQKPGESFLHVLDRVYSIKLGIPAFSHVAEREQLDQLRELRIAMMHYNGSVEGLPESMRAGDATGYALLGLDHYTDLREEFVIPNAEFLARHFASVEKYLSSLSDRVYASCHPA
jgi:hypothetical protein